MVHGDIAWGGNWFFLVGEHAFDLKMSNIEELTEFTWAIRQALEKNKITGADGQPIDHIELFGSSAVPGVDSKNFVLCPGKAYDRSPCGTGTSAKLACLYADGKIAPGEVWRQESIVGTCLKGRIRSRERASYTCDQRLGVHHIRELILCSIRVIRSAMAFRNDGVSDVLIAGAGIVGAACAWELAKARIAGGGDRVRSFRLRARPAASMGHIVVMDDSEAQFALTRFSQQLWDEMRDEFPATVEFDPCGTIWVAVDDEEMAEVRRKCAYYQDRGVRAEILDSGALRGAEPYLKTPMAGGLLVEGDSVVYPPAAAAFFLERASTLGATVYLGRAISNFSSGNSAFGRRHDLARSKIDQCGWAACFEAHAGNSSEAAQRPSGDHGSLPGYGSAPIGGAGLFEDRHIQ